MTDKAGRYHLMLTSDGRPVQHGWWGSDVVAGGKFTRWVGEYGDLPDARITLVDTEARTVIHRWPEEP